MQENNTPGTVQSHGRRRSKDRAKLLSIISLVVSVAAVLISVTALALTLTIHRNASSASQPQGQSTKTSQASKSKPSTKEKKPQTLEGEGDIANGDIHVKLTGFEKSSPTTYEGKPAGLLTYELTNTSDENTSLATITEIYQNGMKLNSAAIPDDDALRDKLSQAESDCIAKVQPGTTITCYEYVELRDETSPVTVNLNSPGLDEVTVTRTYQLQ